MLPDRDFFDDLLARGHRRLGQVFYRPGCAGCRSCVPIRVPVDAFTPSKSQRRLWRRVAPRYEVHVLPPLYHDEHFELYERHSLHVAEDNTPGDAESYARAFLTSSVQTHLIEYRSEGQLVGASILDEGSTALSSVYVFWDPDLAELLAGHLQRALGAALGRGPRQGPLLPGLLDRRLRSHELQEPLSALRALRLADGALAALRDAHTNRALTAVALTAAARPRRITRPS